MAKRKAKESVSGEDDEAGKDVNMDADSSSSEDTSDEAFHKTHTIEEERERAKYEGNQLSYSLIRLCVPGVSPFYVSMDCFW